MHVFCAPHLRAPNELWPIRGPILAVTRKSISRSKLKNNTPRLQRPPRLRVMTLEGGKPYGENYDEVEWIIDWCQTNEFWHSNILSPGKLRKQFTQLVLKAKAGQVVPMRRENAAELLRGLGYWL